jgi:acyl-CoA synthetase (AMP-forming)/AMP-acid ligase II
VDLTERLAEITRIDPAQDAICQDGRWDTWADVAVIGKQLKQHLSDLPPDAFIGLISRNSVATISALLGLLAHGRAVLLLNEMQSDAALAAEIRDLRPTAILGVDLDWRRPLVREAVDDIGSHGFRLERAPEAGVRALGRSPDGLIVDYARAPGGCAVSIKTSGTTGRPRRVEVSYSSLAASIEAVGQHHSGRSSSAGPALRAGVTIQMLSLAHTSALQAVCVTVCEGRRLVLLDRFEPAAWAAAVREHEVMTTGVPPAGLRMILDANVDPSALSSLRAIRSGSAPPDPDLAEEFEVDLPLGGIIVPAGATIVVSNLSANHDESVWGSDPGSFDIAHERAARHLAFASGRHSCVGAALARTVARHAIDTLMDRFSSIEIVPGFTWERKDLWTSWGGKRLDVTCTEADHGTIPSEEQDDVATCGTGMK